MILITGATGFIGKNLVPELAKKNTVRILVRKTSNIELFRENRAVEIIYGDLEHNVGLVHALDGVDIVVHSAARTIGRNFVQYYKMNTQGTANLIQAMRDTNVKNILLLSSHAACGPTHEQRSCTESEKPVPISSYGLTKKLAEDIVRRSGISYIILRPVSVYGPHDYDILKYINLLNSGICPIVGFGEKYLNFIYVKDLVRLIITIIETGRFDNKTYFINDGNCYSYTEVLSTIEKTLHKGSVKIRVPMSLAMFIGVLNDVFLPEKKRGVWRDKVRELAASCWLCSNENCIKEFKFTPRYSLKDGMQETIDWYKTHGFFK
jgi:nucleoside-diphosphate-sugar epimerase